MSSNEATSSKKFTSSTSSTSCSGRQSTCIPATWFIVIKRFAYISSISFFFYLLFSYIISCAAVGINVSRCWATKVPLSHLGNALSSNPFMQKKHIERARPLSAICPLPNSCYAVGVVFVNLATVLSTVIHTHTAQRGDSTFTIIYSIFYITCQTLIPFTPHMLIMFFFLFIGNDSLRISCWTQTVDVR